MPITSTTPVFIGAIIFSFGFVPIVILYCYFLFKKQNRDIHPVVTVESSEASMTIKVTNNTLKDIKDFPVFNADLIKGHENNVYRPGFEYHIISTMMVFTKNKNQLKEIFQFNQPLKDISFGIIKINPGYSTNGCAQYESYGLLLFQGSSSITLNKLLAKNSITIFLRFEHNNYAG